MRSFPRISLALILIVVLSISLAFGWTRPKRIITTSAEPIAAVSGSNIYIVSWGNGEFDFVGSTDNGSSWSNPIQPADTFYGAHIIPDIKCASSGKLHIVWLGQYREIPSASFIFHQSSSNGGNTWSRRHQVFNSNGDPYFPCLATKGDTLFAACWLSYHVVAFRSFNSGQTWRDSTIVDNFGAMMQSMIMLYSNGRVHLIYDAGLSDVGYQVCYSYSDDFGLTWSSRLILSDTLPPYCDSQDPATDVDENGNMMALWYTFHYGSMCGVNGDIVGRISTDNGNSWLPETRLTYTQSGEFPNCTVSGDSILAVWPDSWPLGCDYPKIEMAISTDWGTSWSEPAIITGRQSRVEHYPIICSTVGQAGVLYHCLYGVEEPGTSGLYYIRNKYFYSDRMPMPDPQPIFLSVKAYPNVFNSSTMISIDNKEGGDVEVEIYNLLGQRIWNNSMEGKEGNIIWDATDMDGNGVSSGTYFVRATTQNNSSVIKMIYLK